MATRALSESGAFGPWRRHQVELFSISKLITCMMEPDDEWLCMDFHFNTGELTRPLSYELLTLERSCHIYRGMESCASQCKSCYANFDLEADRASMCWYAHDLFGLLFIEHWVLQAPSQASRCGLQGMAG